MKAAQHPSFDGIQVIRLGRSEWRVNAATDPDRPIGYIERQRAGRYEVTWMTDPMRWGYATTFDEALVAFGDSVQFPGDVFDTRAVVVGRSRRMPHARRATWVRSSRQRGVA
jgi:hypothetical protein